jgi:hypothetical protein
MNGNPGDFRLLTTFVAENVPTIVNLGTPLTYNPSTQGAINSLNYSVDLETTNGAGGTYTLLLEQGGVNYVDSANRAATANTWATFSESGRTASDFSRLDGMSGTPDFSVAGSVITFGYFASFGGGGFFTSTMGVDNFGLTVNSSAVSTPEPGSFSLLFVGVFIMAVWTRLRRQLVNSRRLSRSAFPYPW